MTTQLVENKCDGGQWTCSPPKECCKQGCCFLFSSSIYKGSSASLQPGTVFNPLFLGHWYFWLAVTATVAGILCACSLWRKHSQGSLCCRDSGRDERASEPDSNGSCYAPPQYSRCNSFHQAPPPYSESELHNDPDETESDNNATTLEDDNSRFSLLDVPETPIVIDPPSPTPSRNSASQPPSRTPSRTSTATTTNSTSIKRSKKGIIEKACESLYSQNQDEFDAVGNNVACKLRKMNDQKIRAEHLINKMILLGIKLLNDYSDVVSCTNNGNQSCHASLSYPGSNPNQANIYTTAEKKLSGDKKHSVGPSNDTFTVYTLLKSRQAYQQELSESESNNGLQSRHASVNYPVSNPNQTNINTTAENILSGNETTYNCDKHSAGPSNDTFNIHTENKLMNSQQVYRQKLSEFVTF